MSKRLVIDINTQRTYEETIPPAEQAEIDAMQAALTAQRQADETARAAIQFGTDADNLGDLNALGLIIQNHRAFLANTSPTLADVVQQVRRLTRAQLGILRGRLG